MKKIKLSKREFLLSLLVMFVLLAVSVQFVFVKNYRKLKDLKQERAQLASSLMLLKSSYVAYDQHKKTGETRADLPEIERKIPDVMKIISAKAAEHDLNLRKLVLVDYKDKNVVDDYFLSLELEAPFLLVGQFLESLEQLPVAVNVKSVQVDRFDGDFRNCWAKILLHGQVDHGEAYAKK
ncbi:MAG: type 4a pilus biogenesis protein PilO [Oligoflexia bacterium]|nr:type 4a pilus biogenesis protein PilO [Oligoflexia bacterium]MBF0367641.1 type 4a pilus biogenesis protein PilO [Oligoflexia bacterium]